MHLCLNLQTFLPRFIVVESAVDLKLFSSIHKISGLTSNELLLKPFTSYLLNQAEILKA